MEYPAFCGESYVSQSPLASVARAVNFYPEKLRTEGRKVNVALYPTPGLTAFAAAAESPGRGIFAQENRCFSSIGNKIYEAFAAGVLTLRGAVSLDTNPVQFTTNGDGGQQLGLASAGQFYLIDLATNAFSNPTGAVNQVLQLDGRFVGLDTLTSTLRISNLLNGLIWSPNIAQRSSASDAWRAMALSGSKEIFILGEFTGDVWYNAGTSPFPLAPRQGILITPGIAAAYSLAKCGGDLMWLGNSDGGGNQVVLAQGYQTQAVSTEAVDHAIGVYKRTARIDDAVAFAYEEDGHHFYEINFPTADATWVFDKDTGWWHERGTWDGTTGRYKAWGPQYFASAFGKNLVCDHRSGTISRMGIDLFQDAGGAPLRRLRVAPGFQSELKMIYIDLFRLYLQTGVGLSSGQGVDPQVFLSTSYDGGQTYGSERWRSGGKQGKTALLVDWRKLGGATDWAFQIVMSDPVPWRILGAYLERRMGT